MVRFTRNILVTLSLLFISGCYPYLIVSPNMSGYIVRVEADTDYDVIITDATGGQSHSGWSDVGIRVVPPACWTVRKRRIGGMIRAFGTYSDYHRGSNMHPRWDDQATTSAYGTVRGCM